MKNALGYFGIMSTLGVIPLACEPYNLEVDAVNDMCEAMGFEFNDAGEIVNSKFEFRPVGDASLPTGSFEFGVNAAGEPERFYVGDGAMIVDDDDLTDDYPIWLEATELADELKAQNPEALATYASMSPDMLVEDYTEEQTAAVAFVESMVTELLPFCTRLADADATGIPPRPGDDLTEGYWPSFTSCKDKYNASGDGVLDSFELLRPGAAPQDEALAQCPTLSGGLNRRALNAWGPLSTQQNPIDGLPVNVRDGWTYSGMTIPLESSPWKQTLDRSEWEGVAFWARLATASEAIPIGPTPVGLEPFAGKELPEGARAQDGVAQLGVIIQTFDTGAVLNERGEMDFMNQIGVCLEGQTSADNFCFDTEEELAAFPGLDVEVPDGEPAKKYAYMDEHGNPSTPEVPVCLDYSPTDSLPGEEAPFRDQCWDGFRTMLEITPEWRFYYLPFSEMRQAGWGRVAKLMRMDQMRSVNLLTSAFQPTNFMIDEIAFYRTKKSGDVETSN